MSEIQVANLPGQSRSIINGQKAPADVVHGSMQALFAVVLFSLTIPITQLALMDFSVEFIAASRALMAGVVAWLVVQKHGWSLPPLAAMPWLLLSGFGVVLGFPYLLTLSLTQVPAADMGVVLAGLPMTTSLLGAWLHKERHTRYFWLLALSGFLLLATYVVIGLGELPGFGANYSLLLIATLILGGIGYSAGAKAAKIIGGSKGGWQTICWTLVLYLPLSALWWGINCGNEWQESASTLTQSVPLSSWLALIYLALCSQLWGFKFWYQALASHGVGRISQLQLLQPFFTLFFISLLLQQSVGWLQILFCCLIVMTVCASMKYSR